MIERQNKLKLYKLTKPDLFSVGFKDAYQEYLEYMQNQNKMPKKPLQKQWQQNVTDFFNYGFNEHTLQIYVHKITQLSDIYRKQRQRYIEKCEQHNHPLYEKAKQLKKLSRDSYPIDLGGLFIPADDRILNIDTPLLENLYESRFDRLDIREMEDSFYCTGESLLYRSRFIQRITEMHKAKIYEIHKEYNNQNKDLYLFEQAAKVFPELKQQQTTPLLTQWPLLQLPPPIHKKQRSRSRTPKKKNKKSHKKD